MMYDDANALKWGNVVIALLSLARVATFDAWAANLVIVLNTNPLA